jgi:hypothetical protein
MGTDCYFITTDGTYSLGRLYIFADIIDEGKTYDSSEIRRLVNEEIESLGNRIYWLSILKYLASQCTKGFILGEDMDIITDHPRDARKED